MFGLESCPFLFNSVLHNFLYPFPSPFPLFSTLLLSSGLHCLLPGQPQSSNWPLYLHSHSLQSIISLSGIYKYGYLKFWSKPFNDSSLARGQSSSVIVMVPDISWLIILLLPPRGRYSQLSSKFHFLFFPISFILYHHIFKLNTLAL